MSRGFTIVEIVVTTALFAAMLLAISVLAINFYNVYGQEQGEAAVAGSASAALAEMSALTLVADQVLSAHTLLGTSYSSSTTTLVLEIPAIDSTGNIIAGNYDYAAFYLSGAKLYRTLAPAPLSSRRASTKLLSTTVAALTVTYDNADFTQVTNVTADLQTSTSIKGQTFSAEVAETMPLRNH